MDEFPDVPARVSLILNVIPCTSPQFLRGSQRVSGVLRMLSRGTPQRLSVLTATGNRFTYGGRFVALNLKSGPTSFHGYQQRLHKGYHNVFSGSVEFQAREESLLGQRVGHIRILLYPQLVPTGACSRLSAATNPRKRDTRTGLQDSALKWQKRSEWKPRKRVYYLRGPTEEGKGQKKRYRGGTVLRQGKNV